MTTPQLTGYLRELARHNKPTLMSPDTLNRTAQALEQSQQRIDENANWARESIDYKNQYEEQYAEAARLRSRIAQLGRDGARLDWLEANKEKIFCLGWDNADKWVLSGASDGYGCPILGEDSTVRGCIDAAMKSK